MIKKTKIWLGLAASLGMISTATAAEYEVTVTNLTSGIYFTPVIVAAHPSDVQMFAVTEQATPQLQAIAEGGDVSSMAELLEGIGASVATGGGLVAPGASETFTVSSDGGNGSLSLATMLLPTNDGFTGVNSINLGSINGSATFYARGYDAGTEGNDELVGTAAIGEPGFPAPPPVAAGGTGTGGTGFQLDPEGFIHVHRGVIGDMDPNGGVSDINSAVHRFLNPVARVNVQIVGGGDGGQAAGGPSAVASLSAEAYSSTALEIFWGDADSSDSIVTSFEVTRDGAVVATNDGRSFFESGLDAGTTFIYQVTAIDAEGRRGPATSIEVSTF